jgi:hypothetical protein
LGQPGRESSPVRTGHKKEEEEEEKKKKKFN